MAEIAMEDEDYVAERSQAEIRQLLRRLDPNNGSHKDRVRRLNRFRNYVDVDPQTGNTPDFYDDDLPLLLLGSQAPASYLDEELVGQSLYGLLQACGTPSQEHHQMLKRSARNAMSLLKYLVLDWREVRHGKVVDTSEDYMNPFAIALCSLSVEQLQLMNLELHIEGDKRGGAREDTCHIIVLVCTRHLLEDGETISPLKIEDVLPTALARKVLDHWLKHSATPQERNAMITTQKSAAQQAIREILEGDDDDDDDEDDDDEDDDDEDEDFEENDPLGRASPSVVGASASVDSKSVDVSTPKKEKKKKKKQHKGPAVTWEQCELFRVLEAERLLQQVEDETTPSTPRGDAEAERRRQEEEKAKLLMQQRDPLGLRDKKEVDLRHVEERKNELLEQNLKDLEDEMKEIELDREKNASSLSKEVQEEMMQRYRNLEAQKDSLETVLDSITHIHAPTPSSTSSHKTSSADRSILPTDSNFDPILFLTLVHGAATYEDLSDSMNQLGTKTDNQVQQLQKLVRDNFALFVRCADGIDVFNDGTSPNNPNLVEDRMDSLEGLALAATDQSRKSFKPLLDNTNEVRKVQSALAVLQRVVPILQAPHAMRNHLENGRFSEALKAYRRVLVVEDHCNINLLNHVKYLASEEARNARRDLEGRLAAQDKGSWHSSLLEAVRDLTELLELDIPPDPNEDSNPTLQIGEQVIFVREHPPALACLLLQAAHFKVLVGQTIAVSEQNAYRIYEGESLSVVSGSEGTSVTEETASMSDASKAAAEKTPTKAAGNKWKYDVLDARVMATMRAVDAIRNWLPRLLQIGSAAREDEKHRAARTRKTSSKQFLTAFEVFITNVAPDVMKLVDHATFCALGSTSRGSSSKEIKMSFGRKAPDKLRTLLKSPLPPTQSAKCARELADLVGIVGDGSTAANGLRPKDYFEYTLSPLEDCKQVAKEAVITIERRRCIFAFDVCARTCSSRASGSGRLDGEALLSCLRSLSEELTRPEECASEIEKGCELVVRRCCEGLASYVRDRGDSARLRAVSECANALTGSLRDVIREVDYMGGNSVGVEEVMEEDVMGLEGAMFDEYLDNVRSNVATCCRISWLDVPIPEDGSTFPAYLSASLLAIVRCRAQVERALQDKVRRSEGVSYQYLAMAMAADGVVEGICKEVKMRKTKLKVKQADRLANELQFLMNTLKQYLSDEALGMMDATRRALCNRRGVAAGDGPDGLAALEELERLGRVYVLCLNEGQH